MNRPDSAFQAYMRDPVVQKALTILGNGTLVENLLRDAFMRGARFAADAFSSSSETKLSGSKTSSPGRE